MKSRYLIIGFTALSLVTVPAQTFKVIHSFTNSPDGARPPAGLVLSGSTLYGTTRGGGGGGYGTVFKVDTNGTGFTVLTNLGSYTYTYAGLVLRDGTLYGTTYGDPSYPAAPGPGTVFKIGTNGTGFTNLTNVDSGGGEHPMGGLVLNDSTLYGTTSGIGGSGGTVFKVNTNGTDFTVLRSFTNSPDGADPQANLVLDGSMLYGTTCWGGSSSNGVVFKVDTNGTGYAILKSFSALSDNGTNSDGADPLGGLVLNGSTLYGTTFYGGVSSNGVVFKINTDGTGFAVLKHFPALINGTNSDGANPYAGLILNGNTLYGTTIIGGSSGVGVVFSLTVPPEILVNDDCFGVRTNCFGFNVAGISNLVVVMEACTNLAKTNWVPLKTNTLGADAVYFSDSKWTNYPGRFYRIRVQ